jgi:preprotein translocase subunit SecG
MEKLILVSHLLIAVAIVVTILLQQGKGAEAGASFGSGASQTLFGSTGSWSFFSKITAVLAALFFATSLTLTVMARNSAGVGNMEVPALEISDTESPQLIEEEEIPSLDSGNSNLGTDESGADYNYDIPELDDQLPDQ